MEPARRRAVPIQLKMMLGSRLQSEDAKAAKHAETLGRSGCFRAIHRNPGQSPAFATMLARRLALGLRRYWRLRHVKENKRLVPHEPRRHDRDVSAFREERRCVRPRFDRNLAVLGAERDAERRGPGLSPANALPESEWTDDFRLQVIVVMPPQKLKVGVVEEGTRVGGTLALMDTAATKLQSEVGQCTLGGVRIFNADEHVIDGQRHLFLRLRSTTTLFRFARELRGAFRNDDSLQHARCQCKDKGDLTIWFDLAGVAKAE